MGNSGVVEKKPEQVWEHAARGEKKKAFVLREGRRLAGQKQTLAKKLFPGEGTESER